MVMTSDETKRHLDSSAYEPNSFDDSDESKIMARMLEEMGSHSLDLIIALSPDSSISDGSPQPMNHNQQSYSVPIPKECMVPLMQILSQSTLNSQSVSSSVLQRSHGRRQLSAGLAKTESDMVTESGSSKDVGEEISVMSMDSMKKAFKVAIPKSLVKPFLKVVSRSKSSSSSIPEEAQGDIFDDAFLPSKSDPAPVPRECVVPLLKMMSSYSTLCSNQTNNSFLKRCDGSRNLKKDQLSASSFSSLERSKGERKLMTEEQRDLSNDISCLTLDGNLSQDLLRRSFGTRQLGDMIGPEGTYDDPNTTTGEESAPAPKVAQRELVSIINQQNLDDIPEASCEMSRSLLTSSLLQKAPEPQPHHYESIMDHFETLMDDNPMSKIQEANNSGQVSEISNDSTQRSQNEKTNDMDIDDISLATEGTDHWLNEMEKVMNGAQNMKENVTFCYATFMVQNRPQS